MAYDHLSAEELEALMQELREALATKRGRVTKAKLVSLLDTSSSDFLGSGMSFQEFFAAGEVERIQRSYGQQVRTERKRRLDLVVRMSVEYDKVLQQTIQSSAFARGAIEATFEGDWEDLKIDRDALTFEGEDERMKRYAPIYANFRALIDEALTGVPTQDPLPPPLSH